jgi:hypothetical protein
VPCEPCTTDGLLRHPSPSRRAPAPRGRHGERLRRGREDVAHLARRHGRVGLVASLVHWGGLALSSVGISGQGRPRAALRQRQHGLYHVLRRLVHVRVAASLLERCWDDGAVHRRVCRVHLARHATRVAHVLALHQPATLYHPSAHYRFHPVSSISALQVPPCIIHQRTTGSTLCHPSAHYRYVVHGSWTASMRNIVMHDQFLTSRHHQNMHERTGSAAPTSVCSVPSMSPRWLAVVRVSASTCWLQHMRGTRTPAHAG